MITRRLARIASRIQFLVTSVLQRELHDPRLGFITVLRVEPTADLKEANVYYSVFGDLAVRRRTHTALEKAAAFIQREVGHGLETRNTPRLQFILDENQEKQERMERLIEQALEDDRKGQENAPEPSHSDGD